MFLLLCLGFFRKNGAFSILFTMFVSRVSSKSNSGLATAGRFFYYLGTSSLLGLFFGEVYPFFFNAKSRPPKKRGEYLTTSSPKVSDLCCLSFKYNPLLVSLDTFLEVPPVLFVGGLLFQILSEPLKLILLWLGLVGFLKKQNESHSHFLRNLNKGPKKCINFLP